jgi:hypothetical protein
MAAQISQIRTVANGIAKFRPTEQIGGYRAGGVSGAITESSSPPYLRRAPVADGSLIP